MACDFYLGVSRKARLDEMPVLGCVTRVLQSTPAIARVTYRHWGDTIGTEHTIGHQFLYSGDDVEAELILREYYRDGHKHVEFEQTVFAANRAPSQDLVNHTRPVMVSVEANLEHRCGLNGLTSGVRERCGGVKCPTLAAVVDSTGIR